MPDKRAYFHVTPKACLSGVLETGLVPSVGRRASAAGEPTPRVWLFPSYSSLEDAMLNWLGDELDGLDPVALKIVLDPEFADRHMTPVPGTFECVCDMTVPPECIVLLGPV